MSVDIDATFNIHLGIFEGKTPFALVESLMETNTHKESKKADGSGCQVHIICKS